MRQGSIPNGHITGSIHSPVREHPEVRSVTAADTTIRTDSERIDHDCPFCIVAAGGETDVNAQHDVVLKNQHAIALISPRWWPNNKGHVLIVSKEHYENLYELPREHGYAIQDLLREVAIAIRNTYDCHGVSTRQHNEPAGGQEVRHFHAHIFPRFTNDNLYTSDPIPGFVPLYERQAYAAQLRQYFTTTADT